MPARLLRTVHHPPGWPATSPRERHARSSEDRAGPTLSFQGSHSFRYTFCTAFNRNSSGLCWMADVIDSKKLAGARDGSDLNFRRRPGAFDRAPRFVRRAFGLELVPKLVDE